MRFQKMRIWIITTILIFMMTNTIALPLNIQKWQTQNGAQIIFYQTNDIPMLDIDVAFAAGSAYDGKRFGLSTLTTNLLNQGNGALNATQVAEALEQTGAQFNAENSRDIALFHLRTLTNQAALQLAVDTFALILNKPQFYNEALNREKNQLLSLILQQQESPDDIANTVFFSKLYENHPYAHPINGTAQTVKTIQSWQVRHFYKQYYVGSNAIVVMVGKISQKKASQLADKIIGSLPKGEAAPTIAQAQALTNTSPTTIAYPSTQTSLRLGQLGITHKNPNYFPLLVGNYILGGGSMVSQLSLGIRENHGLSYNVNSQLIPLQAEGPFIIALSTKNNQAQKTLQLTHDILIHFLKHGPTEQELADAKQYLAGNFALSLASNNSIANMLLRMAFYRLPDDYLNTYIAQIEKVTTQDIKTAFNYFIKPDSLLQITVGKL